MITQWQQISGDSTRLALRRLFAAYLVLSGSAFLFPHRPAGWIPLALLHGAGVMLLLGVRPFGEACRRAAGRWPRLGAAVSDWYALAVMPLLYSELATLNVSVHGGRYFDGWVQGWELRVFGGEPSQDLAAAFPIPILSELLHFFYLSYYLIIFAPPLYLYLRGRIPDQQRVVFTLMLAFFGHYLFFVFFPVQGPRYLSPAPVGAAAQGLMYELAHALLEAGSSQGSAFPSSHVGVAVAQTAMAFLLLREVAPVLLMASTGLALGAVYGGFHYATDVFSGLLLGLALFWVAPGVAFYLGKMGPGGRTGSGDLPGGEAMGPGS